jgi:hypothetical protein
MGGPEKVGRHSAARIGHLQTHPPRIFVVRRAEDCPPYHTSLTLCNSGGYTLSSGAVWVFNDLNADWFA